MCLCLYICLVCVCSVWDALTDNYLPSSVSSWDCPNSETLNGNLSDDEVRELETSSGQVFDVGNGQAYNVL